MNTEPLDVIEQAIAQAKEANRVVQAAKEQKRADYLEEGFRVILNALGEVGAALRPYMSEPAHVFGDNINVVQVKVTGAPKLCDFVVTCDLRYTGGANVWLSKASRNYYKEYEDVAAALFSFRGVYERLIEELRQLALADDLGQYSTDYFLQEASARINHHLPDLWPIFNERWQQIKLAEEKEADRWAAYLEAYEAWQAQINRVKEENVAIVADLQAGYNTPYRLYTLSYSSNERDEEYGEPLGLLTKTVLCPEPDADGWWLVLRNNNVYRERFMTVVSVREEEEHPPTKRGWGLYIDLPDHLTLRVSPFHWKELATIEAQARAALKPLPLAPRHEDFGLEPEEDDIPY